MSLILDENLVNISRGKIAGAQPWVGYGKKTTAGADSGVLWPNGVYKFPPAAGIAMSVVSTSANDSAAGTGLRTVDVHYLDENLVERVETVTLNGVTPVALAAPKIRFIQRMHALTFGSGAVAAGNISAYNGANTYSYISAGEVRCTSSVRMVPAGKRLIVASLFAGCTSGTAAAKATINAATPTFDTHDFTSSNFFMPVASAGYQDSSSGLSLPCPMAFTAGQSFGFTFSVDKAATIVASWFGWLENAD